MTPLKILAAALLLAAAPAVALLWSAGGEAPDPAGAAESAVAPAAGSARTPRTERVHVAADALEEVGGAGAADAAEPPEVPDTVVTRSPPANSLPPDEEASVFADGRLTIALSVDPPLPHAGEPFQIVTTFRNDGTGPLRFHVPELAGTVPFPGITLRGADGTAYMPVARPRQSMWTRGLQGAVVRLEPGETHDVRTSVSGVAKVPGDPEKRDHGLLAYTQQRHELPPGDYTVAATMTKERPVVPWGESAFRETEREVAGLWTGTVRATPLAVRVAAPDAPVLTLSTVGEDALPGLVLEVANRSGSDQELRGPFALRRAEKGGPTHVAWFAFGDAAQPAPPDAGAVLRLAAGETRTCTMDIGSLLWDTTGGRSALRREPWPFDRAHPAVWVTCGSDGADAPRVASNTLFTSLSAAPDLARTRGLSLEIDAAGLSAQEPFVTVRVVNRGSSDAVLPARLRSPRRLHIVLRSSDGERPGDHDVPVAETEPYAALTPDDLIVLAPGAELRADVRVARDWARSLPAGGGVYALRARWAGTDACRREGFDQHPLVGVLHSDDVPVSVPAR